MCVNDRLEMTLERSVGASSEELEACVKVCGLHLRSGGKPWKYLGKEVTREIMVSTLESEKVQFHLSVVITGIVC